MDPTTIYLLEISLSLASVGILAGWLYIWWKKPKNYLIVHVGRFKTSRRIKKHGTTVNWIDPANKTRIVNFPLDASYAYQTKNGSLHYYGDPKTGLLLRFPEEAPPFEYLDPKYQVSALGDGRVLQIARAMKGGPVWEAYILPGIIVLGIVAVATLFMVYKMYSSAHGGA